MKVCIYYLATLLLIFRIKIYYLDIKWINILIYWLQKFVEKILP